jgi:hypothetical protein
MIVTTVMNKAFSEIKVSLVCYYLVQKEMTIILQRALTHDCVSCQCSVRGRI